MSDVIFTVAQFIFILWPLFILTALIYSFQGSTGSGRYRRGKRHPLVTRAAAFGNRIRHNLLLTWAFLFAVWVLTMFAPTNNLSLIPEPWNSIIFLGGFALLLLSQASALGLFRYRIIARVDMHRTQDLQQLKDMDPYAFEALVTETYRALGYKVQHVGHSGDHGVDVEMHAPDGTHWVVQCKRYHDSVGESIIRDLYGTMTSEKADRAALVTTAEITPPARAWAQGKPIQLIDGHALLDLIAAARDHSEGTAFDRFAHWLYHLFIPQQIPPRGLQKQPVPINHHAEITQPVPISHANEVTQPVFPVRQVNLSAQAGRPVGVSQNGHTHTRFQVPICPNCGLPMVPKPVRPTDRPGRILYRCQNYPTCRIVLQPELQVE